MKRREFMALVGGAAVAMPLNVRAQQPAMPVIGFLTHFSQEGGTALASAFRKGLSETGFVEMQNVAIEYRWADNHLDRLPAMATELVRRPVALIAAPLSTPAALAAKAATGTIPIVFAIGVDPVRIGLVTSLNRPGGNITGVSGMNYELGAKRLGLLRELLPQAKRFAVLANLNESNSDIFVADAQAAAKSLGIEIEVFPVNNNREIDGAFTGLVEKRVDAILVAPNGLLLSRRQQIVGLCLRHGLPALYPWREAVEAGGLMSYASSVDDLIRQIGIYAGRILKGEKAVDLPVIQASKFEFVVNLQTAKTIGIDIPASLLATADEVIE
jgi:putative tryptophan/tyrosine transport system substrate-binding protein